MFGYLHRIDLGMAAGNQKNSFANMKQLIMP
jgi:hypothetical protein